jgi:hypothetical protein
MKNTIIVIGIRFIPLLLSEIAEGNMYLERGFVLATGRTGSSREYICSGLSRPKNGAIKQLSGHTLVLLKENLPH